MIRISRDPPKGVMDLNNKTMDIGLKIDCSDGDEDTRQLYDLIVSLLEKGTIGSLNNS